MSCFNNLYARSSNQTSYGEYLQWLYAKEVNDVSKLKKTFNRIDLSVVKEETLEELFFESVIFDDWENSKNIASEINKLNKENLTANLFLLVDDFISKKELNLSNFLNLERHLDTNFIKALNIWISKKPKKYSEDDLEECIPLICVHYGLDLLIRAKKKRAYEFFKKIEEKNFSSTRVNEILLFANLKLKNPQGVQELIEVLSYQNLNLEKYSKINISNNLEILNPVLTRKDGLAEVFYNISSWYYQKNLYKYSIFFGKLSLKLRKDFNAMRLLLASSFEIIDLEGNAEQIISNPRRTNPYFMKFLKMRLSFQDSLKNNNDILEELRKLSENYPKNWEIKILLADKYRSEKLFTESIKLYSQIIENEPFQNKWSIFYSRGIAFERLNKWDKAESDLKMAMKLKPDDPYVINYLAYSWLDRKKNIEEALNLLEKAVELEPMDGYILDSLGWAYYLSNFIEKSIYFLEKAVSFLPGDATLNDHLGDAYWKAGRFSEAQSQWKRVLIIDPEFKNKEIVKKKISSGL
jgi:tetratricopeptide (TPR) repeat protein